MSRNIKYKRKNKGVTKKIEKKKKRKLRVRQRDGIQDMGDILEAHNP